MCPRLCREVYSQVTHHSGGAFATLPPVERAKCVSLHTRYKARETMVEFILQNPDRFGERGRASVISLLESAINMRVECLRLCPAVRDNGHYDRVIVLVQALLLMKHNMWVGRDLYRGTRCIFSN